SSDAIRGRVVRAAYVDGPNIEAGSRRQVTQGAHAREHENGGDPEIRHDDGDPPEDPPHPPRRSHGAVRAASPVATIRLEHGVTLSEDHARLLPAAARFGDDFRNASATLPTLPAPSVRTRSPGRTRSRSSRGISSRLGSYVT